MFALDEFYTPNPPGLPDDLNIERATQLVSRDFEFAQVLLRAFQEIIYLPDPKHLQLLLHRRQIVMYEDGSQSYCQGEYSGGAMSEDQMIQDPEVTRVRVLKEIYNRITSQLVPEMIKIWNAEIQVKDAQNWSRDNMEQKAVEGEIE